MRTVYKLYVAVVAVGALFFCVDAQPTNSLVIKQFQCVTEFDKFLIQVTQSVQIINNGSKDVESFSVLLPREHADKAGDLAVRVNARPSISLHPSPTYQKGIQQYEIAQYIRAKGKIRYEVTYTLPMQYHENWNQLTNTAAEFMIHDTLSWIPTAYPCPSQKIYFAFVKHQFKHASIPLTKMNSTHFMIQSPNKDEKISVVYALKNQIGRFRRLSREIRVTHEAYTEVLENSMFSNERIRLQKEFDRTSLLSPQMQKNLKLRKMAGELLNVESLLPREATYVEYYDNIGNISTSIARKKKNGVYVDLLARFPLLGQWKAEWYLKYFLPSETLVYKHPEKPNNYLLSVLLGPSHVNHVIENYTVSIMLPISSKNIEIELPRYVHNSNIRVDYRRGWADIIFSRPVVHILFNYFSQNEKHQFRERLQIRYQVSPFAGLKFLQYAAICFLTLFILVGSHRLVWFKTIQIPHDIAALTSQLHKAQADLSQIQNSRNQAASQSNDDQMKKLQSVLELKGRLAELLRSVSHIFRTLEILPISDVQQINSLTEDVSDALTTYSNLDTKHERDVFKKLKGLLDLGIAQAALLSSRP